MPAIKLSETKLPMWWRSFTGGLSRATAPILLIRAIFLRNDCLTGDARGRKAYFPEEREAAPPATPQRET